MKGSRNRNTDHRSNRCNNRIRRLSGHNFYKNGTFIYVLFLMSLNGHNHFTNTIFLGTYEHCKQITDYIFSITELYFQHYPCNLDPCTRVPLLSLSSAAEYALFSSAQDGYPGTFSYTPPCNPETVHCFILRA